MHISHRFLPVILVKHRYLKGNIRIKEIPICCIAFIFYPSFKVLYALLSTPLTTFLIHNQYEIETNNEIFPFMLLTAHCFLKSKIIKTK